MDIAIRLLQVLVFPGTLYLVAMALFLNWVDRKLVALWQGRVGPPPFQPLADLIKLLAKEDITTKGTPAVASALLPIAAMTCTMTASLFVPVGNDVIHSFQGDLIVALFLLSFPSLAYFLAGWITPSVYGVLGGNRALLQYFTYEVPMLLGMAIPAVYSRSWSIMTLVDAQHGYHWHLFVLPIGFVVALIGLIGKLERVPFDIPHAKSEIGAGPLTEYSGRKLALWRLTVMLQTLVGINLLVAVYLGGADRIWLQWGFLVYLAKVVVLMVGLAFIQVLYARLRIDQMAEIGWRLLVPLGLLQMVVTIWIGG
ncbi:MAG: NADH-quinone oxidoreductase subunit H [Chloroflexi bacterium]|nr:NADH-quinone oxidoreductase subunit H [Chloroflexota bacterium]